MGESARYCCGAYTGSVCLRRCHLGGSVSSQEADFRPPVRDPLITLATPAFPPPLPSSPPTSDHVWVSYFFATPSQGGKLTGEALAAGDERHPGVLPAAPAQGLPCPGTRKSLVWTSLFWIPARVPFCHLLPLPRDFLVLVRKSLVWTSGLLFWASRFWPPVLDFPFFTFSG